MNRLLALLLSCGFSLVLSRPEPDFVGCDLQSVRGNNPTPGLLNERPTVMGNPVEIGLNPRLAEISANGATWFSITLNSDIGGRFLVHSFDGPLRVDDSGTATVGSCDEGNAIIYNARGGDVIGWLPNDAETSIITVFYATGFGGSNAFRYLQLDVVDLIEATAAPTEGAVTEAPTVEDIVVTESPTESPTVDDGSSGGGDAGVKDDGLDTEETLFRIVLTILTLFYAAFVWSVVQPLPFLK